MSGRLDIDSLKSENRKLQRAVEARQGVITLVHSATETPMKTLVRTMTDLSNQEALHVDPSLLGWMLHSKTPLLLNDPHHDDRFKHTRWDASIQSILGVPMFAKSKLVEKNGDRREGCRQK